MGGVEGRVIERQCLVGDEGIFIRSRLAECKTIFDQGRSNCALGSVTVSKISLQTLTDTPCKD